MPCDSLEETAFTAEPSLPVENASHSVLDLERFTARTELIVFLQGG